MEPLLPKHGGYRKLISFQVSQLIYDVTVRFCERYIDVRSRTKDQMVQAARSGVQNIAEGSQASATSKKTELKLTQVARASLEELRLDYDDFLRQRGGPVLLPDHPALCRFRERQCSSLADVQGWAAEEHVKTGLGYAVLAANGAMSLLNVACHLLDRQVRRLADDFENQGGFTERLYRVRSERRKDGWRKKD